MTLVPLNLLYPSKLSEQEIKTTNWNFKEGPLNSRTFQGQIDFQGLLKENPKFKDFSRTVGTLDLQASSCIFFQNEIWNKDVQFPDFDLLLGLISWAARGLVHAKPSPSMVPWSLFSFSHSSDNGFFGFSPWILRGKIWNFQRIGHCSDKWQQ